MDSILTSRGAVYQYPSTEAAPATPLTAAKKDKLPTENHAVFPPLASSSAWSASSVGNTSQESPASSRSDADTEFDVIATQLEPVVCMPGNTSQESPASSRSDADTEFDAIATQLEPVVCQTEPSDTVAGIKNAFTATMDVKRVERAGSTRKTSALLTVDSSPEQSTAKRRRASRSTVRSPGHCYEERGLSLPRSDQIDPKTHGGGDRHSGDVSCIPRHKICFKNRQIPTPRSPLTQGSRPPPRHRDDALVVCHQERGRSRRHSEASIGASGRFATRGKARTRSEALSDFSISSVSQGADKTETPQPPNKQEYDGPMLEARAAEAAAMREVGITGREEFKKMMSKLGKIGWRNTNSLVSTLGGDTWKVKPGLKVAKARPGVEKFETSDAVINYVRELLQLDTPDTFGSQVETYQRPDASLEQEDLDTSMEVCEDAIPPFESQVETYQRPDASLEQEDLDASMEVCENAIPPTKNTEDGTAESGHDTRLSPAYEALQSAMEALQPLNAPAVLKQRTAEYQTVLQFVKDSVSLSCGGSLYLCGCPGTGKTLTMARVQEEVERTAAGGKILKPEFHVFRGTAFTEHGSMYSDLWHAITGDVKEPDDIQKALSKRLSKFKKSTTRSGMIVVVVDEIDQLISHNHDVVRKLFEWADAPKSRLVLVGIANSMEFDVGFSDLRKTPAKILFPAYSPANLVDILTERVGGTVAKGAIELCSRKVAATHGDARRAINVCREAVVFAKRELQDKLDGERAQLDPVIKVPLVAIRHMSSALACTRLSRYKDAIAALSVQAQIILCVAAALVASGTDNQEGQGLGIKSGKCARLTQGDLQDKFARVWGRLRNGEGPSQVDFSGTIDMLAAQGLMQFKGKRLTNGRARQLVLPIEMSDVEAALSSQPFFKTATGF